MPAPTRSLYRVVPWLPGARAGRPGHPAFTPVEFQGDGRIDNPDRYASIYMSDSPAGAVAEAFGNLSLWSDEMFLVPRWGPAGVRALTTFRLTGARVLNLDDPAALLERALRPSRVVTRERAETQAWAQSIFDEDRWAGVSWWSFYDAGWASFGLWDSRATRMTGRPAPLHRNHEAVRSASETLNKVWLDE